MVHTTLYTGHSHARCTVKDVLIGGPFRRSVPKTGLSRPPEGLRPTPRTTICVRRVPPTSRAAPRKPPRASPCEKSVLDRLLPTSCTTFERQLAVSMHKYLARVRPAQGRRPIPVLENTVAKWFCSGHTQQWSKCAWASRGSSGSSQPGPPS